MRTNAVDGTIQTRVISCDRNNETNSANPHQILPRQTHSTPQKSRPQTSPHITHARPKFPISPAGASIDRRALAAYTQYLREKQSRGGGSALDTKHERRFAIMRSCMNRRARGRPGHFFFALRRIRAGHISPARRGFVTYTSCAFSFIRGRGGVLHNFSFAPRAAPARLKYRRACSVGHFSLSSRGSDGCGVSIRWLGDAAPGEFVFGPTTTWLGR